MTGSHALFAGALLFASTAAAERPPILRLLAPLTDAVDVPTNAALVLETVFIVGVGPPEVLVDDVAVDVVVEVVSSAQTPQALPQPLLAIVRPTAGGWPADAAVVLRANINTGWPTARFHTGPGPVDVVDSPPVLAQTQAVAIFRRVYDLQRIFFIEVGPDDGLLLQDRVLTGAHPDDGITDLGARVDGGRDAFFNDTITARFARVLVDGTFSSWGEVLTLRFPGDGDCDGVADDVDVCPAEPGASRVDDGDGCPATGRADFRCEGEGRCQMTLPALGTTFPACDEAVEEPASEGEGEGDGDGDGDGDDDDDDDGDGDGCASMSPDTAVAALVLLGMLRRRRHIPGVHR